jgi:hypothetical protein
LIASIVGFVICRSLSRTPGSRKAALRAAHKLNQVFHMVAVDRLEFGKTTLKVIHSRTKQCLICALQDKSFRMSKTCSSKPDSI